MGLPKSVIQHGFRHGHHGQQQDILHSGKQTDQQATDAEDQKRAIQRMS